jgi:hypothetical protein
MDDLTVSDIPVVILAGGKGTRIREETEYKPKPMGSGESHGYTKLKR